MRCLLLALGGELRCDGAASAVRSSVHATGDVVILLPATSALRQFRSRNCPQYSGTGPNDLVDQVGTRHGGSAAWISRT
jgi:hypothetical protein